MQSLPPSRYFPPAEHASRHGLLLLEGRLSLSWLIDAYRHGIFPWPLSDGTLAWWSPDPRAVFDFEGFHVSRRLERTMRSARFEVTMNKDFDGVIRGCATAQDRTMHTWITGTMLTAYRKMHHFGHAHSVEVWHEGELAGGIYGIALGAMFAGESMFYRERDASKVALVHLLRHLEARGYQLFDIQQLTAHSASLGARAIPRAVFLSRLAQCIGQPVTFGTELAWQAKKG